MFTYFSVTPTLLFEQLPFPHISLVHAVVLLITSTLGAVLFLLARVARHTEWKSAYRANIALQISFVLLCSIGFLFASSKQTRAYTHPIDILIQEGGVHFDRFLAQAGASKTLEDAVLDYRKRYNQHPPP